jgi:hypothetical protein
MCDPVSVGIGMLGGMAVSRASARREPAAAPSPSPADEQAAAEARAAQSANAKLAQDQRRRREQQSLLARGAPPVTGPTLGDSPADIDTASPLSGGGVNRATAAKRNASLLARGAASSGAYLGASGAGGRSGASGGGGRSSVMAA